MLLKLWNEIHQVEEETHVTSLASAPMIIAMRVKVTTFHCKFPAHLSYSIIFPT